jgi:hypothetical protein
MDSEAFSPTTWVKALRRAGACEKALEDFASRVLVAMMTSATPGAPDASDGLFAATVVELLQETVPAYSVSMAMVYLDDLIQKLRPFEVGGGGAEPTVLALLR